MVVYSLSASAVEHTEAGAILATNPPARPPEFSGEAVQALSMLPTGDRDLSPAQRHALIAPLDSVAKFASLSARDRGELQRAATEALAPYREESYIACREAGIFRFSLEPNELGNLEIKLQKLENNTRHEANEVTQLPFRPLWATKDAFLMEWPRSHAETRENPTQRRFVVIRFAKAGKYARIFVNYLTYDSRAKTLAAGPAEVFESSPLARCLPENAKRRSEAQVEQRGFGSQGLQLHPQAAAGAEVLRRMRQDLAGLSRDVTGPVAKVETAQAHADQQADRIRGEIAMTQALARANDSAKARLKTLSELRTKIDQAHDERLQRLRTTERQVVAQYATHVDDILLNDLLRSKIWKIFEKLLELGTDPNSQNAAAYAEEQIQSIEDCGFSNDVSKAVVKQLKEMVAIVRKQEALSAAIADQINGGWYLFESSRQKDLEAVIARKRQAFRVEMDGLISTVKKLRALRDDRDEKYGAPVRAALSGMRSEAEKLESQQKAEQTTHAGEVQRVSEAIQRRDERIAGHPSRMEQLRVQQSEAERVLDGSRRELIATLHPSHAEENAYVSPPTPWESAVVKFLARDPVDEIFSIHVHDDKRPELASERALAIFTQDRHTGLPALTVLPTTPGAHARDIFSRAKLPLTSYPGTIDGYVEAVQRLVKASDEKVLDKRKLGELKSYSEIVAYLKLEGTFRDAKDLADVQLNYIPSQHDRLADAPVLAFVSPDARKAFGTQYLFDAKGNAIPMPPPASLEKLHDQLYGARNVTTLYPIPALDEHHADVVVHELVHVLDFERTKIQEKSGLTRARLEKKFDGDFPRIVADVKRSSEYRAARRRILESIPQDEIALSELDEATKEKVLNGYVDEKIFGKAADGKSFKDKLRTQYLYVYSPAEKLAFAFQIDYLKKVKKMTLAQIRQHFTREGFQAGHPGAEPSAGPVLDRLIEELYRKDPKVVLRELLAE